jgi:prephenate dehydrogenase
MTEDAFENKSIAIIGLGLMGGSLALALREQKAFSKIIAVDQNADTCAQAIAHGIEAQTKLAVITQADAIVLATPVRAIVDLLPRVGALAKPSAILIDLGSTKRDITQAMNALPAHLQVIGAHPMCGKETAGFASADATLFQNALFLLTSLPRTSDTTLAFAQSLARKIGARPLIIDAERHDKIVAVISHLPYVLASTLMLVANAHARDAASDTAMMLDILLTNRANIAGLLRESAHELNTLAGLIDAGDETNLRTVLESSARQRRQMFNWTPTNANKRG